MVHVTLPVPRDRRAVVGKNGWANFRAWAQHPDADAVIEELEATGALTPGLNWCRANLPPERFVEPAPELPAVQAPTLGVWSSGDVALTEAQMTGSEKYVSGSFRYERIDDTGHCGITPSWRTVSAYATATSSIVACSYSAGLK